MDEIFTKLIHDLSLILGKSKKGTFGIDLTERF